MNRQKEHNTIHYAIIDQTGVLLIGTGGVIKSRPSQRSSSTSCFSTKLWIPGRIRSDSSHCQTWPATSGPQRMGLQAGFDIDGFGDRSGWEVVDTPSMVNWINTKRSQRSYTSTRRQGQLSSEEMAQVLSAMGESGDSHFPAIQRTLLPARAACVSAQTVVVLKFRMS